MRHLTPLFLICFFNISFVVRAQEDMTPQKLRSLITQVSDTLVSNGNSYQFVYANRQLICVHDENANRMRIISPISEQKRIGQEELQNALVANFHSALDVKYAISDEIIWSVFTHPLKELSDAQVLDAIEQVFNAAETFGTTYSSTNLLFPGNSRKQKKSEPEKILNKT